MSHPQPANRNGARSPAVGTTSHGRGGAGNISSAPTVPVAANDLSTPTIKTAHYTTGRGGTGNMATNDPKNPEAARAAQDVEAPAHHERAPKGTFHWGRGGEGNMMTVGRNSVQGGANGEKKGDGRSRSRDVAKKVADVGKAVVGGGGGDEKGHGHANGGREHRGSTGADGKPRRSSFKDAVLKGKEKLGLKKGAHGGGAGVDDSAIED